MSGVSISVTIEDKEIKAAFGRLASVMSTTRPVMAAIGTGIVKSTHQRFISQTDPEGKAWQALNPEYAKTKRNSRILVGSGADGGLLGSINSQATSSEVRVGPNKIYAAIHQLGGTIRPKSASHLMFRMGDHFVQVDSVTLPARPYLGISRDDEVMISETVFSFIDRYLPR